MAGNILFVARSTGQWSDSQHCMNIVVISSAPENTGTEVEKIIIRDHFLMKQNKFYNNHPAPAICASVRTLVS